MQKHSAAGGISVDDYTKALEQIEERRNAPTSATLTKDLAPEPFAKADGETGTLEGYITRYWVVDSYGEVTAPGSFSKSMAERGPAGADRTFLRYEHEHTIGKITDMAEDELGVTVSAKVSDDGMFGSAVRAHLKDGVPYGMSIGFRRIGSRAATADDPLIWDYAPDYIKQMAADDPTFVTVLTEVKNLEDSVVTFPAVENALVTNYRSTLDLSAKAIDRLMADLKAGRLTDDHLLQLRRLVADLPADSTPTGEMPKSGATQTAIPTRNFETEFAHAQCVSMLAGMGISL